MREDGGGSVRWAPRSCSRSSDRAAPPFSRAADPVCADDKNSSAAASHPQHASRTINLRHRRISGASHGFNFRHPKKPWASSCLIFSHSSSSAGSVAPGGGVNVTWVVLHLWRCSVFRSSLLHSSRFTSYATDRATEKFNLLPGLLPEHRCHMHPCGVEETRLVAGHLVSGRSSRELWHIVYECGDLRGPRPRGSLTELRAVTTGRKPRIRPNRCCNRLR